MISAKKAILSLLLSSLVTFAVGEEAFAVALGSRIPHSLPSVRFMTERVRAVQPFAHLLFCQSAPLECGAAVGPPVLTLTPAMRRLIFATNSSVNDRIRPVRDNGLRRGFDEWKLDPASGDCEDYAITKRHELIGQGIPASVLRLASARTSWGEGHMVLIIRSDNGDLVLDNLTNAILDWRKVDLRWMQIQSAENPRIWFKP